MNDSETRAAIDSSLNCTGVYCPMPIIQTRQALGALTVGQILEVLADDLAVEEDIQALVESTGQKMISIEKTNQGLRLLIQKVK